LLKPSKKPLILGIILARSGSKTVKDKNIALINGKPLIWYTVKEAIKSKVFDEIIVSTDSEKYKKISIKCGVSVPFLRPKKLSTGKTKAVDCLKYTLKRFEKIKKKKYQYIIELMCTNPLKNYIDIKNVAKIQKKTKADSVIAVHKVEDGHPIRAKKIVNGKIKDFCLREIPEMHRQQLHPNAYFRSGSIYSMRRDMLLKGIRYGTKNSIAYVLPKKRVINIDEKIDFEFAKFLIENN
jgi:CMP-N,N'-diacetyllegionaminic acid synthase